ncbi:MAG: hypothetical protein ACI884_002251, partial [Ulvibacter sp.]
PINKNKRKEKRVIFVSIMLIDFYPKDYNF